MTRFTARLVPERFRDTAERERHATLLVILVLLTTGFSAFYFGVSAWVRHPPGMWAMTGQMVGFLALLPAVHAGLSLRAAGNAFALVSFVGIGTCVTFQGGLLSPVIPWFVFPALMALLLVGPTSGVIWTGLCAAATAVFGGLHLAGADLPVVLDPTRRALLDISSPAGLVLIVFSVAYALETGRRAEAARVSRRNQQLAEALDGLKRTQDQLIQSEKLASLSTVTAGVAHELKNPLNFVNNFAGLSVELVEEIRESFEGDPARPCSEALAEAGEALDDLAQNVQKIADHGRRADAIVRSMLLTARGSSEPAQPTGLNDLVARTASQTLDGWLAHNGGPPPLLTLDLADDVGSVPLSRLDAERALANLLTNAFDAVQQRAQTASTPFEPRVRVATRQRQGAVEIRVADNGGGIAEVDRPHVFEPFYTTKPTGSGTGLGLALVHEVVVRRHRGTVDLRPRRDGTVAVVRFMDTAPVAETTEALLPASSA